MKHILILVVIIVVLCNINAQKVGIGTTSPEAKLDVAGDARVESILVQNGVEGEELMRLSTMTSSFMLVEQDVAWAVWGGNQSGWQTIVIDDEVIFDSIRMFFTGTQTLDTIKLFSGAWPNVTLISALPMNDIPSGQAYRSSPWFNETLQPGTYTIWLDNINKWHWGSGTPYPGVSSIGGGIDFKFQLYGHDSASPLRVIGEGAAELDVNGKISCNEFQLGSTTIAGNVLTANPQGFGAWQPMPVNPWTVTSDNIFYQGGNVGIGNNNPSVKLDVTGKIKSTQFQLTTGATNGYVMSSDASGNASWISNPNYWTLNGSNIYLNQTGNIGIGTTTPTSKMHLAGGAKIRIDGGLDPLPYFSFGGDGKFSIDAPNVPDGRFIVENGGSVGIGVTDPVEKLDVNGNMKFHGTGLIVQDAPVQVSFQNSWSNSINVSGGPVKYVKDKEGYIHLRGLAEHPSGVNGTSVIFTLPAGFRPAYYNYINVASNINGGWARIEIRPNGEVVVIGNNVIWVCLDNIQFRND